MADVSTQAPMTNGDISLKRPFDPTGLSLSSGHKRASNSPRKRQRLASIEHHFPLSHYVALGVVNLPLDDSWQGFDNTNWIHLDETTASQLDDACFLDLWPLIQSTWIRASVKRRCPSTLTIRIYVLPEDIARSKVNRDRPGLRRQLERLLPMIVPSAEAWYGHHAPNHPTFDLFATAYPDSLFYIFNTLPSPDPHPEKVTEPYSHQAILSILDQNQVLPGLQSHLYPYQQRSAAMMLQREAAPERYLDPRLDERISPLGDRYYYVSRDRTFYREPRLYESVRGGILAESMGLGKTLICIALIIATRHQLPDIPPTQATNRPIRSKVGTLGEMAASASTQHSIALEREIEDLERHHNLNLQGCRDILEQHRPFYYVQPVEVRPHRSNWVVGSKQFLRCSGTIIVVPPNLVHQWKSELEKHVEPGSLSILVLQETSQPTPTMTTLSSYDVVLFSRPRFEFELGDNLAQHESSPVQHLHWLRIIVDEGHSFSSKNTRAVNMAKSLRVDRRWVVSGTPARDLLGVEVDVAAFTDVENVAVTKQYRDDLLEQRKEPKSIQDSKAAVESIGSLASHFLQAQPWHSPDAFTRPANWWEEVYRHEVLRGRTYSCFSACFKRTLQSLVVKTQADDVERDIVLPPLTHEVIRLEPSYHDKLTANNFVMLFTTNAVTSERSDTDYLFHPNSQAQLHRLVNNLRQSTFNWTGLNAHILQECLNAAYKYLDKTDTGCTREDQALLQSAINASEAVMSSAGWNFLTSHHDIGFYFEDWPNDSASSWSIMAEQRPLFVGLAQAWLAQQHINDRLSLSDSKESLAAAGVAAMSEAENATHQDSSKAKDEPGAKAGVLAAATEKLTIASAYPRAKKSGSSPIKPRPVNSKVTTGPPSPEKETKALSETISLGQNQLLAQTKLVGTSSAKMSYLLSRISELYKDEKILVFYEGDQIAYYLSYALDILHIRHLWYTKELKGDVRSRYVVLFDTDPHNRVMLMDVTQAAHGLNLSAASRVIFVTPPYRPNIFVQAVKRAHRIGQTRPVKAETLVLKGTIEEAMHDRAGRMTSDEHSAAKLLEDDGTITRIIQQARMLHIEPEQVTRVAEQIAWLAKPQQFWGRPGRDAAHVSELERELFPKGVDKRKKGRVTRVSKATESSSTAAFSAQSPGKASSK